MSNQKTVHIIGAGMAGLTAAVYLASKNSGHKIKIYESANHAGGRCYSFYDKTFDKILDNCPHLILGANKNLFKLLETVDALGNLTSVNPQFYPFADVKEEKSWVLQPSKGKFPFWIFYPPKRIPKSHFWNYLAFFKLARTKKNATVEDVLSKNPIYESFWLPFCKAVLNTHPGLASTKLLYRTISRVFGLGGKNAMPYLANKSLKGTLVDPILEYLAQKDVEIIYNKTIRGLGIEEKVDRIFFEKDKIFKTVIGQDDAVILATTAENTFKMLPTISTPKSTSPIICVHFLVDDDFVLPKNEPFYAIIGGVAEWVFAKKNLLSVVISAPRLEIFESEPSQIAEIVWEDLSKIPDFTKIKMPLFRVVKEKNATILHNNKNEKLRKDAKTEFKNLFLAGDWTNTGMPSSIEGAVFSGFKAGEIVNNYLENTIR